MNKFHANPVRNARFLFLIFFLVLGWYYDKNNTGYSQSLALSKQEPSFGKGSDRKMKVVCNFLDRLRLENRSYGRLANYAECCRRILQIRDDKNISEWTKKEIEAMHKTIADADYENSIKTHSRL